MRLRARIVLLAAGVLAASVAGGCGGSGQARKAERTFRREFRAAFEQYRGYDGEKALALARGEDGRWAYGFARRQDSQVQAVNAATQQCKRRRARYGVEAPCRTYAVGDEITGDPALVKRLPAE